MKASAWKTIHKTQYNSYEDYFQVFRGFSKESYPETKHSSTKIQIKNLKLIKWLKQAYNSKYFISQEEKWQKQESYMYSLDLMVPYWIYKKNVNGLVNPWHIAEVCFRNIETWTAPKD